MSYLLNGMLASFHGDVHVKHLHALFRIRTVIIPRDRYRSESFNPRVDIGRGMITVLIRKKACINLFITYFYIELKRTTLTSHTPNYEWLISVEDDNSPDMEKGMHCSIYKEAWYHFVLFIKRLDIMLSEFCPDICPWADIALALRCLRMSQIDVITLNMC
jgi:hypothetical protein